MAKGDTNPEGKVSEGASPTKARPKTSKPEVFKEEYKEIPVEQQIKESTNTMKDKEGTIFS